MQGTWPLGILEVSRERLVLRLRPWIIAKITGTEPLVITSANQVAIFPVKSNLTWQGIEFRVPGQPSCYFWTKKRAEILAALPDFGFEVSEQEGRMP
jgi:hypothetical protein